MASQAAKSRIVVADYWVLLSALLLASLGLVMVYCASSTLAAERYRDAAFFAKRQALYLAAGLGLMLILARLDYEQLKRLALPGLLLSFLALIAVFIPGLGHTAGGAARWLRLGGLNVQPSEFAKVALVLFAARHLAADPERASSIKRGILPIIGVTALFALPVLKQPDFGMSVTLFLLAMLMLYAAGARLPYLMAIVAMALPFGYWAVAKTPYRLARFLCFLDPWKEAQGCGFQLVHSLYAFGSGGVLGEGLGGSHQKLFYLPEPHTDFILSVLGEELGMLGVWLVLALFMILIWRGVMAALSARDYFGTYLALGVTVIVGLQAFVNAAVVMGMLPTKGLTMPFMSSGGSSLVANLACVGLLLSVAGHTGRKAR